MSNNRLRCLIRAALVLFVLLATQAAAFERQHRFAAPDGVLRVSMRAGELRVVGGSGPDIAVTVSSTGNYTEEQVRRKLKVRYNEGPNESRLEIGGVKNLKATVTVPANLALRVHLFAGELTIEGMSRDLTAKMFAGEINIRVADRKLYRIVNARSRVGSVEHPYGGPEQTWIGHKYQNDVGPGRYRLEASVTFGEVNISEIRPQ